MINIYALNFKRVRGDEYDSHSYNFKVLPKEISGRKQNSYRKFLELLLNERESDEDCLFWAILIQVLQHNPVRHPTSTSKANAESCI